MCRKNDLKNLTPKNFWYVTKIPPPPKKKDEFIPFYGTVKIFQMANAGYNLSGCF